MSSALYRVRAELGRRLPALLVVAVLVALVGVAVLAAVAGARRTETVTARLRLAAGEPEAFVDAGEADPARWGEIGRLPAVASALPVAFVYAFPEAEGFFPLLAPTGPPSGDDVSAGLLVEGRRPDPASPHEVALSEQSARRLGATVGDRLPLLTYSPAGGDAFAAGGEPEPDGPPVSLDVVGIVRFTYDVQARSDDITFTILTPAFHDRYEQQIAMERGQHLVRLHDGREGLGALARQLRAAFAGGPVPVVEAGELGGDSLEASMTVLSVGLMVFAGTAAVFGLVAVGLATNRALADAEAEQVTLAALGAGRRGRFLDAWLPLVAAAGVGTVVAVAVAWLASPLFPLGLARQAEPETGLHADFVVLVGGGSLLAVVVIGVAAGLAWRVATDPGCRADRAQAPGKVVGGLLRSGNAPLAVGVGMATRATRGSTATPTRAAAAGVLVGVVGVVAVLVFGASFSRVLEEPARYGWTWDVSLGAGDAAALAASDATRAVATGTFGVSVEVDGEAVHAVSLDPVEGDVALPLISGRRPLAPDEVAVGAATRDALADPDRVTAVDAAGAPQELRVVGTTVFPTIDDPVVPLDRGIWLTDEGLRRLGFADPGPEDSGFERIVVRLAPGIDQRAFVAGLGLDAEDVALPQPPPEVERLDQVRALPRVLAALLGTLATLATANALWQTVRRRRRELAVLRALGFVRAQVRWAVTWQGATIALVATAFGVPLGLVAGRWAWALVAGQLGIEPGWVLPAGGPLAAIFAVVASALAGAAFGTVAAAHGSGRALRTE